MRHQERLDTLTADIDAIDARRQAFEAAIGELITATAAADLAEQPATSAAAVLHRRATEARAAAAEREALAAELAALEAEQAEAAAIVAEAEEELAALRAPPARPMTRSSRSVRTPALGPSSCGPRSRSSTATLPARVARPPPRSPTPWRRSMPTPCRRAPRKARGAGRPAPWRARRGRRSADPRPRRARAPRALRGAAQAAQAKASLEAQIQELAERYARARLAQRVLRDAIARYRSAHEGPLLARASALFPP